MFGVRRIARAVVVAIEREVGHGHLITSASSRLLVHHTGRDRRHRVGVLSADRIREVGVRKLVRDRRGLLEHSIVGF